MAYNQILDTQVDPDAPITSGLGYQLRDNPIAIANGDLGAPKITDKIVAGRNLISVTFSNLNAFAGVLFWAVCEDSIVMSYSTDGGSSFSTSETIAPAGGIDPSRPSAYGFFDFYSGQLYSVSVSASGNGFFTNLEDKVVSGAGLNITDLKFAGDNVAVLLKPQGGQSAT